MTSGTVDSELTAARPPSSSQARELRTAARVFRTLFFAALLLFGALAAGAAMYALAHSNRIYEGVTVGGVEIGGMTRSEARAELRDDMRAATSQPIILVSGDKQFSLDPRSAGIEVDLDETIERAFTFGRDGSFFERSGDWFNAILSGHESSIAVAYNKESLDATLMQIAPSITRPAIDAYVRTNAEGQPEIIPELPGIGFDLGTTRNSMIAMIASLENQPVQIVAPVIPASVEVADLDSGFAQIESATAAPLTIEGADVIWQLSPEDIRQIVTVGGDDQRLIVNREAVQTYVESIAEQANRSVKDASITVSNGALVVDPSQVGLNVNVAESANLIIGALESGSGAVKLSFDTQQPRVTDEQAETAVASGEAILSRGVTLTWGDDSQELTRAQLLAALTVVVNP
ncbi:MAG: peptidoglycan binding domain-containing protein, partial [Thermomicrobiales bacterium]